MCPKPWPSPIFSLFVIVIIFLVWQNSWQKSLKKININFDSQFDITVYQLREVMVSRSVRQPVILHLVRNRQNEFWRSTCFGFFYSVQDISEWDCAITIEVGLPCPWANLDNPLWEGPETSLPGDYRFWKVHNASTTLSFVNLSFNTSFLRITLN